MVKEAEELDSDPIDEDLSNTLDAIDYLYQSADSFTSLPDESVQEQAQDFVDFMGFHPGTLHKSIIRFTWFSGDMENPDWMGEMADRTGGDLGFETEPHEPFLVVGMILLREKSGPSDNEDDIWTYYLKVLVRDKVGYAPIPIDQMDENGANHFKRLFREIVTD